MIEDEVVLQLASCKQPTDFGGTGKKAFVRHYGFVPTTIVVSLSLLNYASSFGMSTIASSSTLLLLLLLL